MNDGHFLFRRYDCGVIFARQMLPHFVHITFAFSGQLVGEIRKNSLSTKFRVKQYKTRWIVKQSLVAKVSFTSALKSVFLVTMLDQKRKKVGLLLIKLHLGAGIAYSNKNWGL